MMSSAGQKHKFTQKPAQERHISQLSNVFLLPCNSYFSFFGFFFLGLFVCLGFLFFCFVLFFLFFLFFFFLVFLVSVWFSPTRDSVRSWD